MASTEAYQNDLDYYWARVTPAGARVGDKYGYYYRAHLLETNAWANYTWGIGGFSLGVAGSVGYSQMYREGMWRKGLFPNNSNGDSKKLDYLTYEGKLSLGYRSRAPIRSKPMRFTCSRLRSSPRHSCRRARATRPLRA